MFRDGKLGQRELKELSVSLWVVNGRAEMESRVIAPQTPMGCREAPGEGFSSVSLEGRGHPPTFRMGVLSLGDGGLSSVFTAGVLTRTSLWAGSS